MEKIKVNRFYNDCVKRGIDFLLALIFLLLLWPFCLLIAAAIYSDSPGPVFYRAYRGGYRNKPFRIFKFRSMVTNADRIGGGTTALNDPRITRTGRFLRKTKLDEIPQLLNILAGEMSFIGPRPELLRYTDRYEGDEKVIPEVRPGITDISSVRFISLDEMVGTENADERYEQLVLKQKNALRIEYVRRQNLWLDSQLFFVTIAEVFRKVKSVFLLI